MLPTYIVSVKKEIFTPNKKVINNYI